MISLLGGMGTALLAVGDRKGCIGRYRLGIAISFLSKYVTSCTESRC